MLAPFAMSSKQMMWKSVPDNGAGGVGAVQVLGDDILGAVVDDAAVGQHLAAQLRRGGCWLDVVAGIDSVAVRFDLAAIDIESRNDFEIRRPPAADTRVH